MDVHELPLVLPLPIVAEVLGVSRSTIGRHVRAGDLPARRLGGRVVVLREDLIEYLRDLPAAAVASA